jgi:hypothetical protein
MRRIDRYFQFKEQLHITVDLMDCSVRQESRIELQINWRNIKTDVCQGLRNVWGFVKEVAIASDVSLGAVVLATGGGCVG